MKASNGLFTLTYFIRMRKKVKINWEHINIRWINPGEIDNYKTVPKPKEALFRVYQL